MRCILLGFDKNRALVVATLLTSACVGAIEDRSPPNGEEPGSGGGSGGASGLVPSGGMTAAGGTVTTVICLPPPTQFAWADCQNVSSLEAEYPFSAGTTGNMGHCHRVFVVPVAPEGSAPTVEELCIASDAAASGWAARITLTPSSSGVASGRIALAPELVGADVRQIDISVADYDPGFGTVTAGEVALHDGVGTFSLSIESQYSQIAAFPRLVLVAKLTIDCGGLLRTVTSTTALYRCGDPGNYGELVWISSGDTCGECAVICEMAASPIDPPPSPTEEPLGYAIRAQLQRIGQYGRAALFQVRHDGGAKRFTYRWDVSGGRVLFQEGDLLLWEPSPQGEQLVQVSMLSEDAAAIASTRVRCHAMEGV